VDGAGDGAGIDPGGAGAAAAVAVAAAVGAGKAPTILFYFIFVFVISIIFIQAVLFFLMSYIRLHRRVILINSRWRTKAAYFLAIVICFDRIEVLVIY
jgi:hypothetical protein